PRSPSVIAGLPMRGLFRGPGQHSAAAPVGCSNLLGPAREDDEAHLALDVLNLGLGHRPRALSPFPQDRIQLGPVGYQGLVSLPDRPEGLNDYLGHLPLEGSVPLTRKVLHDRRAALLPQQLVDLQEIVDPRFLGRVTKNNLSARVGDGPLD